MQQQIIKELLDPVQFEEYGSSIRKVHFRDNPVAEDSYKHLKEYYKNNKEQLSAADLENIHLSTIVDSRENVINEIKDFYTEVKETDEQQPIKYLLNKIKLQDVIEKSVGKLTAGIANPEVKEVENIVDDLVKALEKDKESEAKLELPTLEEFTKSMDAVNEMHWSCHKFNEVVYGFGQGRSCLVFALSNMGKSSWCLNEVHNFMQQGKKVLDISVSEDPIGRRLPRLLQSVYHRPYNEIEERKQDYYADFLNHYKDLYRFKYLATGCHVSEILKDIEDFQPDVVIVDGFSKMRVSKGDSNRATELGVILAHLKSYAELYKFGVIPVCQAAATAKGKAKLTMGDIADSKVAVPAELEMAIGIGFDGENSGQSNRRTISTAKNKLGPEGYRLDYTFDMITNTWKVAG